MSDHVRWWSMSDLAQVLPPRRIEQGVKALCQSCGATIYEETIVEEAWDVDSQAYIVSKRIVIGSFKQNVDGGGMPVGPSLPFCLTCKGPGL